VGGKGQRIGYCPPLTLPSTMSSVFGTLFRISTFGESHGAGVGVIVDGCPPSIPLAQSDLQYELDRRRPGQSKIVTPRKEADTAEILSGIIQQAGQTVTTGTPIAVLVRNEDLCLHGDGASLPPQPRGLHL
jgi:chorismate synthase